VSERTSTEPAKLRDYSIRDEGFHPETGDMYSYKDGEYEFYFYIDVKVQADRVTYDIEIKRTTTDRFAGDKVEIRAEHLKRIEDNVTEYFETTDTFGREITRAEDRPRSVIFSWGMGHGRSH
jgi:hypothetical protein